MSGPHQQAGDDSANVGGDNLGTIQIGLTFQQHQATLAKREAELRGDLERAHAAERALLQAELDAVRAKQHDAQADYEKTLAELADVKATLARYDNQISDAERRAAYEALDRGDRSKAENLFAALEKKAQARADDALAEAAEMAFEQGKIAEAEVRWLDAAEHYARTAKLNPTYEKLERAGTLFWRSGQYEKKARIEEDLLDLSKR